MISDSRGSTTTGAPSTAGPGGLAAASRSRSASRSCMTQRCGLGRSGASHRPIDPLPQARSWITRRPVAGSCRRTCSTRSRARAAASAGSRRSSHSELTRICSTVMPPHLPGRLRARTRWSPTRRATHAVRPRPGVAMSQGGVVQPCSQRCAERSRVAGRYEQPRADAVCAVTEGLRHPSDLGRDHRQAVGERLGGRHAYVSARDASTSRSAAR